MNLFYYVNCDYVCLNSRLDNRLPSGTAVKPSILFHFRIFPFVFVSEFPFLFLSGVKKKQEQEWERCFPDRSCPFLGLAGRDFLWHCKEPRDRSGGILLGVDLNVYDIGAIDEGDFYVKFLIRNKSDGFKWVLVCVYGPAQDNLKESFLVELVNMTSRVSDPILIRGDFNILRNSK